MSSSQPNQHHSRIEPNNIDPDDGNSWLCTACNLPIFATPFTGGGDGAALLHDTCSNLPEILNDCELHPQKPLFLGDNNNSAATCSECSQKYGTKFYYCRDSDCGVVLDVSCALPIKILHRSHRHRLMAVRGGADSSFLICGVCGVAHKDAATGRSYFCNVCGFWIHPECAMSANVIVHEKHVHPLVLYYDVVAAFGAQPSIHFVDLEGLFLSSTKLSGRLSLCAICNNDVVGTRFGIYSCMDCGDCILHINCATSDRRSFKPVLGREAGFKSVVRLPIPDEHHSIVSYVRDATSSSSSSSSSSDHFTMEKMHEIYAGDGHRFILHHHDHDHITKSDEEDDRYDRVCDACLKIIHTPDDPFYSCSICPNFFLHDFCYRIPLLLTANPAAQEPEHRFFFCTRDYFWSQSICSHCSCRYIRAFYTCYELNSFTLDVSCALMPVVVTHEAHGTSHFLRLTKSSSRSRANCDCCSRSLDKLAYECRTCPNFALHTWCAMLPKTVTHKFDPHPLRLITAATATKRRNMSVGVSDICEICEHEIDDEVWYYGCERCEQSFHVDCIPCLDLLYKIKSLDRVGRIRSRDVPTRLIRGLTLQGHGHDYCSDVADEYDILAT